MKNDARFEMRLSPALKRYLRSAAKADHRNLAGFLIAAGLERAKAMRDAGWEAKDPPQHIDARQGPRRQAE